MTTNHQSKLRSKGKNKKTQFLTFLHSYISIEIKSHDRKWYDSILFQFNLSQFQFLFFLCSFLSWIQAKIFFFFFSVEIRIMICSEKGYESNLLPGNRLTLNYKTNYLFKVLNVPSNQDVKIEFSCSTKKCDCLSMSTNPFNNLIIKMKTKSCDINTRLTILSVWKF